MSEFADLNECSSIDKDKKDRVFSELISLLEEKGMSIGSCRSSARKIEKKIRELDPAMGEIYMSKYNEIIEDINKLESSNLEEFLQNYY